MPIKLFDSNMKLWEKIISCITFVMDAIYRGLKEFSKIVLLFIVFVISAEVISRKFFGGSIMWADEVALFFMIWMAFIAMAIGVEKHLHIAIEMFVNKMPLIVQKVIDKIVILATLFFGFILVKYGVTLVKLTMGSTLPATQWPAGLEYLMMPVGGVFILYFCLIQLFGLEKYRHPELNNKNDGTGEEA